MFPPGNQRIYPRIAWIQRGITRATVGFPEWEHPKKLTTDETGSIQEKNTARSKHFFGKTYSERTAVEANRRSHLGTKFACGKKKKKKFRNEIFQKVSSYLPAWCGGSQRWVCWRKRNTYTSKKNQTFFFPTRSMLGDQIKLSDLWCIMMNWWLWVSGYASFWQKIRQSKAMFHFLQKRATTNNASKSMIVGAVELAKPAVGVIWPFTAESMKER